MNLKNKICLVLFSFFLVFACSSSPQKSRRPATVDLKTTVLLISIDGFRADYIRTHTLPNLSYWIKNGISSRALKPSFPTLTFPNHYTLVTGLRPARHGIINNTFKDPELLETFSLGNSKVQDDPRWWGGEPLWVTAEKQDQKAATMFWPGSSTEIAGVRPTYWKPYDKKMPREKRVAQILDWLDLPAEKRPTFLTLYFEDVDTAGHSAGPQSEAVAQALRDVDESLGQLKLGLEERGIGARVNVIVVSDHGMARVPTSQVVSYSKILKPAEFEVIGSGTVFGIYPKPGYEKSTQKLWSLFHPHLKIYDKRSIPERWKYLESTRIPPLLAVADEGFLFTASNTTPAPGSFVGAHGYDPASPSMNALFIADGPAFKDGYEIDHVDALDVYSLMAHILGLTPAPHDGDFNQVKALLRGE